MNFYEWEAQACTVKYSRTFIKGAYSRTWHDLTYKTSTVAEAKGIVNEWNRIALMQYNAHPDNGLWVYVEVKNDLHN